jgi:hypothetical protein
MNQSTLKKVLITGITLLLAAGWARADSHFVTVKVTPDIHSVFVIGIAGNSPITATSQSRVYPLAQFPPSNGWVKTGYPAFNGTQLQVITFTSPDCTFGYTINKILTVPDVDGLTNVWVDATR